MKSTRFFAFVALVLAATAASAQTIYRCGNEYTRVPCANGKSIDADASAVDARRTAEARQGAVREKRLADDMVRDRRAREASQRPAAASSLGPAKAVDPAAAASASMKPKKRTKAKIRIVDERDFVATVPRVKKN